MTNLKIILIIIITAAISLGVGYLLFSSKKGPTATEEAPSSLEVYTCSMHPQIRQNKPGKCPLCGMNLEVIKSSQNDMVLEMSKNAVKLANIQTVEVGLNTGEEKVVTLSGKIKADERLASSLVSHIPGRIEQLFVSFTGERVKKGQQLATLYSPEVVSAQGELIEALKWKDNKPNLLEAARKKLRNWKVPDTVIEQIEQTGKLQTSIPVLADQNGIIINRRVAVGDYVKAGTVMFDVTRLDRLWVLFDAYEEDLASIRLGDRVEYIVSAVPDRKFTARISFIDPLINPQTRVATLRAEVSNTQGLLKPEMFVRGVVKTRSQANKGSLAVPKTAVLWTGPRSVVYVQQDNTEVPSFEFREVEIGEAIGDQYQIHAGLERGERVVVNGAFVIDAAAQLNNMASMMNRQVRLTGQTDQTPDYQEQTPERFQSLLSDLVFAYVAIKDALVQSNPGVAAKATTTFSQVCKQLDADLLKGEALTYWKKQHKGLKAHSRNLNSSKDIEEQRKQFEQITEVLVKVVRAFGTNQGRLYLQYCPMAFNDQGAYWLSMDSEIRNPYFGDEMLTCGITKDSFPKANQTSSRKQSYQIHNH